MTLNQLKTEFNDCLLFLQKMGFSHQENWNHIEKNAFIPNCEHLGFLEFENIQDYVKKHKQLSKKRQFSMLTYDNTIIYIEYKFAETEIAESRYLVLPDLTIYSGESTPDSYLDEEQSVYIEMTNSYQLNFPIRIDFDNGKLKDESQKPVVPGEHSPSHIHLGFIEGCRIPLSRPLSPKIFFKFLIENFYRNFYEENKQDIDVFFDIQHVILFSEEINYLDKRKLYFDICITN